jgi:spore maturation protein CgeB
MDRVIPDAHLASNIESWRHRSVLQVKARHFEIPACGGFMMTAHADDLEHFYAPGKEIAIYEDVDDLARKIEYYLAHDAERNVMARAAYERTVREHTYAKRFDDIFRRIGLKKS